MIGRTQLSKVEGELDEYSEVEKANSTERDIFDELEVCRIVDAIDNAVDRKDWAKCLSFFDAEVDADFTSLAGGEAGRLKAEDLIDQWRTNLFDEKKSHHMRSNHQIEIAADRAEVFSKGYAFNLLESGEVTGLWEVWGNYAHTLTRSERGEWKVSGVSFDVTYRRGNEEVRTLVRSK